MLTYNIHMAEQTDELIERILGRHDDYLHSILFPDDHSVKLPVSKQQIIDQGQLVAQLYEKVIEMTIKAMTATPMTPIFQIID